MNPYTAAMTANIRCQLQYRAAAWAGLATQLFFGIVKVMIFTAFYSSSNQIQVMSYDQVIQYIWLGQALLLLLPFRVDHDMAQLIRSGNLAYEMTRPVDLYSLWYARGFALRIIPVLLRAVPMVIITGLIFPLTGWESWALKAPAGLIQMGYFSLSLCLAFLLSTSLSVLMSILTLWALSSKGMDRLMPAVVWVFSGIIIPLPFYPPWMQNIFRWLPFRGLIDIPIRIYMGQLSGSTAGINLLVQALWCSLLIFTGKGLLNRGLKRLVIQGG